MAVQLYGRPSVVGLVPPKSFYPPPKVSSAILRIDVYPHPAVAIDAARFFRVVRAGFTSPRKQLRNSLARGLDTSSAIASALLLRAGIEHTRRPQTLSLEEWARLAEVVGAGSA